MKFNFSAIGWIIVNTAQAVFTVAWTLLWVTVALVVLLLTFNRSYPLIMARRIWAAGLLRGAGVRLDVRGLERVDFSRPHVFVANHESQLDIPVVFRAIPANLHFILKHELIYVPFVGAFAWATGMIFVDRKDRVRAIANLKKMGKLISSGRSVIAYPEGTRSRGRGVLPFKKGVFAAAIEAGVPVVPVAIRGAEACMPVGRFFKVRPGTVRVELGEPIATRGLTEADREALATQARDSVVRMLS